LHEIGTEHLLLRKLCGRWVPKQLTPEHSGSNPRRQTSTTQYTDVGPTVWQMSQFRWRICWKKSWTLAVSVAINISLQLCFVSVHGPRETYFVDEPRISRIKWLETVLQIPSVLPSYWSSKVALYAYVNAPPPPRGMTRLLITQPNVSSSSSLTQ
jgi:hypothetical protein